MVLKATPCSACCVDMWSLPLPLSLRAPSSVTWCATAATASRLRWPPGGSRARDGEEWVSGEETPGQLAYGGSPTLPPRRHKIRPSSRRSLRAGADPPPPCRAQGMLAGSSTRREELSEHWCQVQGAELLHAIPARVLEATRYMSIFCCSCV
jgi:hypothetical protein